MADVADLVLLAGQLILENGGETSRVEETMVRMALAGGGDTADVFAIPQGIFCTINEGHRLIHALLEFITVALILWIGGTLP